MLMSFDNISAEGSGTQDDPYSGVVELNAIKDMFVEVGTQISITFSVGMGFSSMSGDDIGLDCINSGSAEFGLPAEYEGTISNVGTARILVDNGMGSKTYQIHAVSAIEDLEFLSSPIDDGVIVFA